MAANTIDNEQCEAPPDSKETSGNFLVTVQEVPDGQANEAAPKPTFKRFEDLPEMVEMLSPIHPDDEGNKTDIENLSDHESMDTFDQRTMLVDKEEDSGDENKTDVEDLDIVSVRRQVVSRDSSSQNKEGSKNKAKRFIEEVQLDNLEHKKISGESKWLRNDSNHIVQKPSHSRQRSHSQPCSLSSPGPVEPCQSPRSASSESEFANLSAHVRAVLGELDVRSQKCKSSSEVKRSKLRCPSSSLPYRLTNRNDQERLLKKFFVEEDVGSLTDEGEFVIMPEPRSPTCRLTTGLEELDVSSEGTDVEDLAAEPHNAIGSGGEWTETDPDSGEVRHIISKTTHTTVTSVKPGEGAPRGDTMSTSVTQSSKGGRGDSAASAPSSQDEAESLTFCQKKEFFEKLSEQSPLQETLSSRLGSTPSLDTALTRPVVTVKPRPRSESLTSQGEIIEENIVFAERLRLFQNGAQASSSSGANLPHLDLMDQRRQSRDERLQGLPEMTDSLQQQSSEVFTGQQGTDGKSDTRLLVHTSDADKEAFDVCSVQSSEDTGDQQFSRMRVRMPATEEFVSKAPKSSCGLRGEKPSPLRDAYKESLTSQQEGSHIGKPSQLAALSDNSVCLVHEATKHLTYSKTDPPNQTNKDLTVSERQLFTEQKTSLLSSQSHMLASGLQMGVVAGSGILQKGIEASSQSAIFETLSSSPTELRGLDSQAMSEVPTNQGLTRAMEQIRGKDMGDVGAVVAAAPIAVLPAGDFISGKQIEMLDMSHVTEESSLFEMCAHLPDQVGISQPSTKEKTMMKTEYADIQHKLSSAFGESRAVVDTKGSTTQDVPKEVLAAFDRSNEEFMVMKSDEYCEHGAHISDIPQGSLPHDFIPAKNESMLCEERAEHFDPDIARETSISLDSTHVHLTTKELEICASKEFVEEQGSEEKLESLVALSSHQTSKFEEKNDDSYEKNVKEFVAVLEDQETFPVGELSELKPTVTAYEPHFYASEIDSKCVLDKNKKEDEAGSSIQDVSEISEHHSDDSYSIVIDKKSGVFIGSQDTTEELKAVLRDPDCEESSKVFSELSFGVKKEMCLDSLDLHIEPCPQLGTVSPKQPCEEHCSDITVSSKGEHSLIVEDVSISPKINAIDTQISSQSAATKYEEFPQQASEITTDMPSEAVDSNNLCQDKVHFQAFTAHHENTSEILYSSDEDRQKELSRYKEVELSIPFLRGGSSSLEDEAEDGGSFSSADLQAEKIAEFLTMDPSTVSQAIHFPQIFQDHDIPAQKGPAASADTMTNVEKHVDFVLHEKTVEAPSCVPLQSDRQAEIEEASRIVKSVVHIASTFVESLNEVAPEASLKEDIPDSGPSYVVESPPERSEVSETLSHGGPPSAIEKDHKESLFGVKEMYEVLKESRVEDRIHYSVTSLGDPFIADEADEDQERRRRGSPTAESLDDQAQIEKCSREVMMQLLDGFSQSDVELAEVRTEDEAPDIEDDVPSPEAGSQEEKSVPSSQDNSGDLQPQLSTEVEIGSQASGAPAPLSELDYELCPDVDQLRTSRDEAVLARVPPLDPERDEAVAESSHAPSAAADPATSAGRRAGGRERSPLLEASPPEETAYCAAQDISPAQEYPEYLTPDMQVHVGVSPTEVQPAKEKPVRYSESSVESSSEVGSPCPPGQGGTAMAFENVAFAGEDIIDATSSPVEKSSSPTGSRSPYEVVRDTLTEETAEAAHVKEETLYHMGQEVHPRPQSLMAEECNEQIEQQMKSTIFNEAFDHSPKESAPEKKALSEGLLGVGLLTVSGMTARTPESRRGDSDEDEEEWADHVMSKIRGRPIPSTPPASPRTVQSVEVHDEQVTWETPAAEKEDVHRDLVSDVTANEETIIKRDESAAVDDVDAPQPQFQEVIRAIDGKRPRLEHIPSEISDEDLVEREQSPTHITATCRGDRKDSSSDRNSSPDSDGPKACGSHRRSASGVGAIVLESGEPQKADSSDKYSEESRDQGTQEFDKITEEPEGDMSVIEEEVLVESSTNVLSYDDGNETGTHPTGTLSPDLNSPPKKKDGDDGSISGKLDAASPVVLRSKSKKREKKSEKRSSRDMDTGHSGSETDHSHYYSFEVTSDSGKTPGPSRPTSSEFDVNILSGQASSEYETCATSQDGEVSGSYATAAASSHDTSFATARSSLSGSSRGSAYSVDSESSGHLGSMEVSEASETIVASAHEELDSDNESERSKSVLREPYDGEIPESVIRGGVEHPFLPSWQPLAKEAAPKLYVPVGARPLTSEAALSQGHSAVPVEPERSCTGWPSASSSSAQSNTSRSTSKTEILNGTGSSAPLDGQRRLRYNDDYMASSHEEEQLSVSESSATQSEHTWQTSLETMVDAVEAQRLSCEREFNHRQSTIQNSVSLPFDEAAAEGAEAERSTGNDRSTPPFQEVNGPVEVEYVPEYDDLTARTLRPILEQNIPAGQTDMQGLIGTPEASHGEVSSSRVLDEQEDRMELREEGFYAETFQGDLSSEEVESAADVGLLQSRSSCSYNEYCDNVTRYLDSDVCSEVKNISLREHFERPASPEPVDGVDGEDHKPNTSQGHCNDDNGDSFHHINVEAPMCYDKREIKQDCSEGSRCNFLAGTGSYSIQEQPRSETASSSPGRDTADDIKLYTSKCEDYILQMRQTYKYGVGLSNTSDESSYLPEEGMDVENVKLLASRLQEGNVSHQDFPYDLSYEHEYVGDARVEHGDLYTHQEVEEDADDDERTRLHGRRRLSPISDERGSTPDYDTLGGRKTFGKGSEKDDASTSSLMEFERLEAEMASGAKSSSVGSSDSFSGRQQQIRNGTGSEQDSVSVNSLTEFERLEKEIVEAEGVDTRLRGEAVPKLDEIDEGHESQASDPGHETIMYDENCITLSREITVESTVKEECDGTGDNTHLEGILSLNEQDVLLYRTERHFLTTRTESGHSVDSVDRQSSASTATQFDADSLRDREIDDSESNFGPETPGWTQKECTDLDSMHDSLHDSERYDSLQEALSRDKDSLQLREPSAEADSLQDDCNDLQDSLYEARDIEWDSIRTEDDPSHNWQQFSSQIRTTELSPTLSRPASSPLVAPVVVERIDTLTWVDQDSTKAVIADEELLDRPQDGPRTDALVSSTDSLEPSSSANTHATYQCDTDSMMSSLNSADESTMVSSTDTLDHEALHFATSGKPLHLESSLQMEGEITEEHLDYVTTDHSHNKRRPAVEGKSADDIEERFRECLLCSATSPVDEEQVEERQMIDEKGNLIVTRTVKRHVTSEPRLHAQTFAGPDAEQRSREFVASFSSIEPSSEKDECEGFDAAGNTVRVTQHVLVRPIVKTVTFSGPDAQLQMREYMRNLAGGQQSSAENTPTSDSGVGVCTSLASPPPLVPDPPATAPSSACPGLQRLSGGDHWMEAESALDDSSRPVTATRVITTRTTRTVGPDGREQLVTTTTEEGAGGDEPELRLRRSMQGVLDSFMVDPSAPPPHSDEE